MYNNISLKLKEILEPRLPLFYFQRHNFCFRSITFQEIENIDLDIFKSQKTIVFLLDDNYEDLKYADKLRSLLSISLVFTNLNLFKIFGIPERYFYFNPIVNEKMYFLSNISERTILNTIYDIEKEYLAEELNNTNKITIQTIYFNADQKEKLFLDVLKFLCCGCSVFVENQILLNLFPENIKCFFNLDLTENDKLEAQFQVHKNYSYIVQINLIEQQLYGIFGHINDLVEE